MKVRLLAGTVVVVAATLAVYAKAGGHGFVNYDDDVYVYRNPAVEAGLAPESVAWAFGFHAANWHPLTWLSHMLDAQVFGLEPGGHHLVSVGLHALAAALLFAFLLQATGAFWTGLLAALLFALHPLRVESVAWVSERKDVLSGVFWFGTLLAYVAYARRPGAARYAVVVGLFALGLMAKPMLVTLPVVLLLVDAWPLRRCRAADAQGAFPVAGTRRLLAEKLPLLALAAASAATTFAAQGRGGAVAELGGLPFADRAANALVACATYVGKTCWPTDLSVFYPHPALVSPGAQTLTSIGVLASAGLVVVATAAALVLRRRLPSFAAGWFWFLVTLVPVIGLVQVGHQAWADRYAYLPTVGLILAAAYGLRALVGALPVARIPLAALSAAALVLCGAASSRRLDDWSDSVTLWESALAVNEENHVAHYNLGSAREDEGRPAVAARSYERAAEIRPDYVDAHYALGLVLLKGGELGRAEQTLWKALELEPRHAPALGSLGLLLKERGDLEGAVEKYRQALEIDPDLLETRNNLGGAFLALGRPEDAEREFRVVVAADPDLPEGNLNLALALRRAGKDREAVERYLFAFDLVEPPARAARDLAAVLATSADPSVRDPAEAVRWARHAVEATGGIEDKDLAVLADAHAAGGDFEQAVLWMTKALEMAPKARRGPLRERLERYRAGRAE